MISFYTIDVHLSEFLYYSHQESALIYLKRLSKDFNMLAQNLIKKKIKNSQIQ